MGAEAVRVLKSDDLGRVELLDTPSGPRLRRVACGGALPGSGLVARVLLRRERRALAALAGLAGVPRLVDEPALGALPGADGRAPRAGTALVRTFVAGAPLHRAERLPEDFFERLEELVCARHARGVCHNDLHKEQNVVVDLEGRPALIDFQLASVHRRRGRAFASRARDDLRHVQKHRRRYTRDGRGPRGELGPRGEQGAGAGLERSPLAALWRRRGKPLYLWLTRRVLRRPDGEERRPSSGPWPRWSAPVGPRPEVAAGAAEDPRRGPGDPPASGAGIGMPPRRP